MTIASRSFELRGWRVTIAPSSSVDPTACQPSQFHPTSHETLTKHLMDRFLAWRGNRSGRAQLVEIRPEPSSRFGYDFVPIP